MMTMVMTGRGYVDHYFLTMYPVIIKLYSSMLVVELRITDKAFISFHEVVVELQWMIDDGTGPTRERLGGGAA